MTSKKNNLPFTVLKIGLSAGLLIWAFSRIHLDQLVDIIQDIQLLPLIMAFVVFQVGMVQRTGRWAVLLRDTDYRIPFFRLVSMNYVAKFFSLFIPTSLGVDIVRVVEVEQFDRSARGMLGGLTVLDRMLGMIVMPISALCILPFSLNDVPTTAIVGIIGLVLFSFVMLAALFNRQWLTVLHQWWPQRLPGRNTFENVLTGIVTLRNSTILVSLFISATHYVLIALVDYLVGLSFQLPVTYSQYAIFLPLGVLSLVLPSMQGLGVRENVYAYLLSQVGVPEAAGVLFGLGLYGINSGTGLLGGIWYLLRSFSAIGQPDREITR